jgi:hypothetical protein
VGEHEQVRYSVIVDELKAPLLHECDDTGYTQRLHVGRVSRSAPRAGDRSITARCVMRRSWNSYTAGAGFTARCDDPVTYRLVKQRHAQFHRCKLRHDCCRGRARRRFPA